MWAIVTWWFALSSGTGMDGLLPKFSFKTDAIWGMSWSKKGWHGHDLIYPRVRVLVR
jgi:hypothetical protein